MIFKHGAALRATPLIYSIGLTNMDEEFRKNCDYSGDINDPSNFIWVKSIDQLGKIKLSNLSMALMWISIVIGLIYVVSTFWIDMPLLISLIPFGITFLLVWFAETRLYSIKCPACGYRPSVNKDSEKVEIMVLNDRLLKLTECPGCRRDDRQSE